MAATQTQIDNLIKLLQQQKQQQHKRQQHQQQPAHLQQAGLPDQHYQHSQAQLQALQSFMQLAPLLQHCTQPQRQNLWSSQQQTGRRFFSGQALYDLSRMSNPDNEFFQHGTLTEEQRRKIAIEYNKEESERQVASQKEREKMIDSIKASIRDVIQEQHRNLTLCHKSPRLTRPVWIPCRVWQETPHIGVGAKKPKTIRIPGRSLN